MMERINTLIILEITWGVISSVKCHLLMWEGKTDLCCSLGVVWDLLRARATWVWLLMDSSLPLVEAEAVSTALLWSSQLLTCYYLITMQVLCKNKLWHSWCAGVSRLWDVSHQRWFDYLEKLLFYLSWLCLAYFMELTAGFLPTLTFCFSTDLSSVPWSVLFTGQELITAFNLINLCTVCGTWNTNSLVSSCCCFLLLKLFLCSVVQ